ncbi:MAG: hypothetical protein PWQ96_334 [Clostridia bacterium]|nr:hypothetical protein [Clostridia bacterium]
MHHNIAVYVQENGETANLLCDKGRIEVYQKKQGTWNVLRAMQVKPDHSRGIKGLREQMEEITSFLKDCRIFVGRSVLGISYYELEKAHISIWEFSGKPEEFLDYILEQEEAEKEIASENTNTVPMPVRISNGSFKISLKEIQENNMGFTTKQALFPFLRTGKFRSLEIICNHIPPWLEFELIKENFHWKKEIISGETIKLMITNE